MFFFVACLWRSFQKGMPLHTVTRCVTQERKQTDRLSNSHICCAAILRCFWCRCHFVSFAARAPAIIKNRIDGFSSEEGEHSYSPIHKIQITDSRGEKKTTKQYLYAFRPANIRRLMTAKSNLAFGHFMSVYVAENLSISRVRPECCERQARRNKKPNLTQTLHQRQQTQRKNWIK